MEQEKRICQSCGMSLFTEDDFGKNEDGTINKEYCHYCYPNGQFSKDETLEEMVESCIPFSMKAGEYSDESAARVGLMEQLGKLKRWA